ncbi:MAG TPA: type II toxin-antitoxin system RelE/ParE family toxin [Gammaproteobacteria bacterium]|nr:type II toxin-antitoxin system RelE/ParE family toxin [Gammaproteobacteria bacterium]
MTVSVYLRPEAEGDVTDAAAWYQNQRPGLGQEFLGEIVKALARITDQPRAYPRVHKEVRRILLRRFPFGIFYVDEGGRLVVLAVMHASRNPQRWKARG